MRKMNEEEVTEWIAKFCGFTVENTDGREYPYSPVWRSPYGRICGDWGLLTGKFSFTKSLDGLFKWAVPKMNLALVKWDKPRKLYVGLAMTDYGRQATVANVNASLALCLAIIQAVDGEEVEVA